MRHLTRTIIKAVALFLFIAVLFNTGCQQQKPDPSQELKPIVDKYVEVWNNGNVADLDTIMDPNYIYHSNSQPEVDDIDGMKKFITTFRTAYPDMKLVVEDELFSENKVTARWHLTGTNTGPGEMPPTGKSVDFWGIAIIQVAKGKLKEEWTAFDNQAVTKQLGFTVVPPAAPKKLK
ncbi:MAG: ester cyclase [Ignavibacteriaceae bacterium]